MKTWSAATIRNAGLCASHFHPDDFTATGKLRRDAVPLPFHGGENTHVADSSSLVSMSPLRLLSSSVQGKPDRQNCGVKDSTDGGKTPTESEELMNTMETELSLADNTGLPLRTYEKRELSFLDSEDETMAWLTIDPQSSRSSKDRQPIMQPPVELERSNRNLRRANVTLVAKVQKCHREIKRLNAQLRRASTRKKILLQQCQRKMIEEFLDERNCTEPAARALVKLQLHRKNAPFTDNEKELAKQLFFYSASAYMRLQNAGCNFPSVNTVRRWISEIDIRPRFCPDIPSQNLSSLLILHSAKWILF